MAAEVIIPVLSPGDKVILYNNPSQSVGEVADVLVAHPGGHCEVRVTGPTGSTYRSECRYKHDPAVRNFGPERWTQIATGVWELTEGEKLRRELPARLKAIEEQLTAQGIELAKLAKLRK